MKDKLCLMSYSDIEFDKTYTNISEYFLRDNLAVSRLLAASGVQQRFLCGECSDFELLCCFLKVCHDENAYDSAVVQTFARVVQELLGIGSAFSINSEMLWTRTSEALVQNKLRAMLACTELEELGVPILPNDFFDEHFSAVRGVSMMPVACPFGTQAVSFDTFEERFGFSDIGCIVGDCVSKAKACAVFSNDLTFEKPNEYTAAKAYEKHLMRQTLLNKEKAVLSAQLLRMTALAASESEREMMIFLPAAPNVKTMGAIAELIDYLDGCGLKNKLKLSVFGGDAVSLCMAASISGKRYKNITAVTGICGNGSDLPDMSSAKYWGGGASVIENFASLAKTPALLSRR